MNYVLAAVGLAHRGRCLLLPGSLSPQPADNNQKRALHEFGGWPFKKCRRPKRRRCRGVSYESHLDPLSHHRRGRTAHAKSRRLICPKLYGPGLKSFMPSKSKWEVYASLIAVPQRDAVGRARRKPKKLPKSQRALVEYCARYDLTKNCRDTVVRLKS